MIKRKKKVKIKLNVNRTVISVVIVFETPPNILHKGMPMLLATESIKAISTPALAFNCKGNYRVRTTLI